MLELVEDKKIIGYEILKDTPSDVKGGIYKWDGEMWTNPSGRYGRVSTYEQATRDTEWFKPIYEEKPTEVYVDTLAGKVKVTSNSLTLESTYAIPVSHKEFTKIADVVRSFGNAQRVGEYELKVETFKVGCKVFSVNDIPKIEEAIKQVS